MTPSSLGEPLDLLPERGAALDVEAGRRLVEEEDPRAVHERQRQVEPALHPARVAPHLAVGGLRSARRASRSSSPRGAALGARQAWSVAWSRRCSRPVSSGSSAASWSAAPIDARTFGPSLATSKPPTRAVPAVGREQRRQHVHGRRLPGAVRAEEAVDLAGRDREVDPVDGPRALLELQTSPWASIARSLIGPRLAARDNAAVMVDGTVDFRFAPVRDALAEVVENAAGTGAAVAAWYDGDWVVDLWGGWADAGADTALGAGQHRHAVLGEQAVRRALRAHARRPGEARPRRADAALLARVPRPRRCGTCCRTRPESWSLDEPAPTEAFYDWERLCALLARQEPAWTPGTAHGESALFYGHLVGELVRRVDGRSLGRFLRDEVCGPASTSPSAWAQTSRPARSTSPGSTRTSARESRRKPELYARAIGNPPGAWSRGVVNSAAWRAAEIPAVNGHGTARGAAGLYAALLDGELLSPELLAEATRVQCSGVDRVFGHDNAWGLGFGIDEDGYGMGGIGRQLRRRHRPWAATRARS